MKLSPEEKTALHMESVILDWQEGSIVSIYTGLNCAICQAYWKPLRRCRDCPINQLDGHCATSKFNIISNGNDIPGLLAIMVYLHGFKEAE